MADRQIISMPARQPGGVTPLCFIVDEDFGLRRELSEELRRQAIDVVDFSNSSRLLSMVDDQNPDIVLINVVGAAPHESLRALMALKDCRYGGAVQLFGNCEPKFLESLKVTGLDCGLRNAAAPADADQSRGSPRHHSRAKARISRHQEKRNIA